MVYLIEFFELSLNISISLEHCFDKFVINTINEGSIKKVNEVIIACLKLLGEETKVVAHKTSSQKAFKNRISEYFKPKKHLKPIKTK